MVDSKEFKNIGNNVKIFPNALLINSSNISLGNNVKIDDFVYFNGGEETIIGDYVHITSFSYISGGGKLIMEDFSGISAGVKLFTGTDDFNGGSLTNPTIPPKYRNPIRSFIHIKKHAVVSTNSVILPGVTIGEGTIIGAGSVVTKDCDDWCIYAGSPATKIKIRPNSDKILELEKILRKDEEEDNIF